jgi:hypothetical protein
MLTATYRQAQNAADAAALAAAMDRMQGKTLADATTTATTFVQTYNGLSAAPAPTVNSPPTTGAYTGKSNYVAVRVTVPVQTYLVQVLGIARNQTVQARAVAGYEPHSAGEGVMVLDPNARPGLDVSGGGTLRVNGSITVNSEGGGVDENNQTVSGTGTAAKGGQQNSSTGIFAGLINIVGGVDNPATFKAYDPAVQAQLHCRQLPDPDPLSNLPTPIVSNGVDSTARGNVSVTNNNVQGVNSYTSNGVNFKAAGGESVPGRQNAAAANEVILFPGVYESISITGGTVYFVPGIYVMSPQKNTTDALKVTGGAVTAQSVMFYNTASSYNPNNGNPDANDGADSTPLPNSDYAGAFSINAGMQFSPINTSQVNYQSLYPNARAVSSSFDGMLFFQRRRHQAAIGITGNAAAGMLSGTLYAKWSNFKISGQGAYDAQFICGSMSITGQGNVTIQSAGAGRGKANQIYLVE